MKVTEPTEVVGNVKFDKNFIVSHHMRLAMINVFVSSKLLSVTKTRFAQVLVMLKRFKLIKQRLQFLVINDRQSSYREDNIGKALNMKSIILDDSWQDNVSFYHQIYDLLRFANTDKPRLLMICEMWVSMIVKAKEITHRHGDKGPKQIPFYNIILDVLMPHWSKSNTSTLLPTLLIEFKVILNLI